MSRQFFYFCLPFLGLKNTTPKDTAQGRPTHPEWEASSAWQPLENWTKKLTFRCLTHTTRAYWFMLPLGTASALAVNTAVVRATYTSSGPVHPASHYTLDRGVTWIEPAACAWGWHARRLVELCGRHIWHLPAMATLALHCLCKFNIKLASITITNNSIVPKSSGIRTQRWNKPELLSMISWTGMCILKSRYLNWHQQYCMARK